MVGVVKGGLSKRSRSLASPDAFAPVGDSELGKPNSLFRQLALGALGRAGAPWFLLSLYILAFAVAFAVTVGGRRVSQDACSQAARDAALARLGSTPFDSGAGGLSQSPLALELLVAGMATGAARATTRAM